MRVLLDTHVLIWWDAGRRLSAAAVAAIREADEVFVSAAAVWEVAIKASLGKLSTTRSVALATSESGFQELPIEFRHAEQVVRLPAHHRDPFDRIMIAQAQIEDLILISRDAVFRLYGVPLIAA